MSDHGGSSPTRTPDDDGAPGLRPVHILLVEDNPADVRLTQEVFRAGTFPCLISVAEDGDTALLFLRRAHPYEAVRKADLVLLDLNLPRKDGRELLAEIKGDGLLKSTPVIVLTSSEADEDVESSYALHANCYIVKPVDYSQFVETVRNIEAFWLGLARFPRAAA